MSKKVITNVLFNQYFALRSWENLKIPVIGELSCDESLTRCAQRAFDSQMGLFAPLCDFNIDDCIFFGGEKYFVFNLQLNIDSFKRITTNIWELYSLNEAASDKNILPVFREYLLTLKKA